MRRVAKNILSLFGASVVGYILGFFITVYVARTLGPREFGMFVFAGAFTGYFALLTDMGVMTLGVREVARDKSLTQKYAGSIVLIRLLFSLVAFSILLLAVRLINFPQVKSWLIIFYGVFFLLTSFDISWVFSAHERMEFTALLNVASKILFFAGVFLIFRLFPSVLILPPLQIAAFLVSIILGFALFWRFYGRPCLELDFGYWKKFLLSAFPLGLSFIMIRIYYSLDTVMLGFMKGDTVVGWYNAAYKIVLGLIALSEFYFAAILPILSQRFQESVTSLQSISQRTTKLMATLALPMGIGGMVLARPIMNLIFGSQYLKGTLAFQILIWHAALNYLAGLFAYGLIAFNREKIYLKLVTLTAALNLILNFILIPILSLYGAALATVISLGFAFFLWYAEFKKVVVGFSLLEYVKKPLFASMGMGLILFCLRAWNFVFLLPIGLLAYIFLLFLFKGVQKEDIGLLKEIFLRKAVASDALAGKSLEE